jgi:hypothetical protein
MPEQLLFSHAARLLKEPYLADLLIRFGNFATEAINVVFGLTLSALDLLLIEDCNFGWL